MARELNNKVKIYKYDSKIKLCINSLLIVLAFSAVVERDPLGLKQTSTWQQCKRSYMSAKAAKIYSLNTTLKFSFNGGYDPLI